MAGKLKPILEKKPYAPGTTEAIRIGCKCPVGKNNAGAGAYINPEGNPVFWFNKDCPIHGAAKSISPDTELKEIML
jgi:hypothetical protein